MLALPGNPVAKAAVHAEATVPRPALRLAGVYGGVEETQSAVIYYNENDPAKAEWLRQLMARNVIAKGTVDERSILEIQPAELLGYTQCHFFAGIGLWSYALRLAGWPDERPVWNGSCPCQPFSVAGKGKGAMDERHLWPAWFRLIAQCRPGVVFGEQVADGDGITWLDAVQTDMEAEGYRFGPLVLPAAGFGAPHGRHRIMFVADPESGRNDSRTSQCGRRDASQPALRCANGDLADSSRPGWNGWGQREKSAQSREEQRLERLRIAGKLGYSAGEGNRTVAEGYQREHQSDAGGTSPVVGVALGNAEGKGLQGERCHSRKASSGSGGQPRRSVSTSAINGFWQDAEWIPTRGKIPGTTDWRPIKPMSQPVANGPTADILPLCDYGFPISKGQEARTLRLKGYGDGICVPAVAEFIKAYIEVGQRPNPGTEPS